MYIVVSGDRFLISTNIQFIESSTLWVSVLFLLRIRTLRNPLKNYYRRQTDKMTFQLTTLLF